jgi:predicted DNA-binding transcriptional regulator AlpA
MIDPAAADFVTGDYICDRLGISRLTLARLWKRKRFPPPLKFGSRMGRSFWHRATVDAWVARMEEQAQAAAQAIDVPEPVRDPEPAPEPPSPVKPLPRKRSGRPAKRTR